LRIFRGRELACAFSFGLSVTRKSLTLEMRCGRVVHKFKDAARFMNGFY
jgi:hypothetical protein